MFSGMAARAGAAGEPPQPSEESWTTREPRVIESQLPEGFLIGDQDGIKVDGDGHYYIDLRGLLPGDEFRKTLTIQNLSQNDNTPEGKVPYTLVMSAEPVMTEGPIDLLDKVHLTMKLEGEVVYEGPTRGDGSPDMTDTPLPLGVYAIGDQKSLEITFKVAADMEIHEERSQADFRWLFYAYRETDVEPPRTGVSDNCYWLIPIGGVMLLFVIMVPLKKRRDGSSNSRGRQESA